VIDTFKIGVQMIVKDLEILFDYGYWANGKLFDAMTQLTPEQFAKPLSGNHGSIRNTMVHMLSAEWVWLERCGGSKRGDPLDPTNFPTVASLVETWKQVESHMRSFLSSLRDEDLAREVEFVIGGNQKRSLSVGELMQQAASHGVHHRGQVSLLLRLLGFSPENFDILLYYIDKRKV
jgi:uncharacterized damage-inducible protein DinB